MHILAASSFDTGLFLQQIENGLTLGAIYALVSLGYTLVYGIIELINFAHGDVFMWSTVVTLTVAQILHIDHVLGGFVLVGALLLLLVVGMVTSGVINVAIERIAYRPLRRAPRLIPLISAIGVSYVLENLAQFWKGAGSISYPVFFPTNAITIGNFNMPYLDIFVLLLAIGLMVGLNQFINRTRLGRAMRATAQDPEAAALMGVNINQTIAITFLIGGALAGAAGVVYSMEFGSVIFNSGFQLGIIAFTAAVLGGIGNVQGAVLGSFLIGLTISLAIQYVPNGIAWSEAIVFAILVGILIFRPTGLLGQQVPDKV
jgi:branched-chain amino acid transport system permease protein